MIWYWLGLAGLVATLGVARRTGALRLDAVSSKAGRLAAALIVFNGSWMAYDGARAFLVGDYVTPGGSGELGPWADLVSGIGIGPRSDLMKTLFLVYGVVAIAAALAFLSGRRFGRLLLVVVVVLGLWYLPFGTLLGVIALVLLAR